MMTKEGSNKILNFMTPGQGFIARAWSYKSYGDFFSFKMFFYTLEHDSDKLTKCIVMMTEEGFTELVNFMTPGVVFLC